ncbi:MAG: cupin domain-containing protein [Candidatus Woesearchaeota archaeon]
MERVLDKEDLAGRKRIDIIILFSTMSNKRIIKPEIHQKGWGEERWIINSELYCGKILILKKGKRCSIHYHKIKDETFYILIGKVEMNLYPNGYPGKVESMIMKQGDTLHIPTGLIHEFFGLEYSEILEVSTQHFEEDSHRLKNGD